ncbi:MAG: bactofilin family protein [Alphaproteobacteria bacterium]
MFTKAKKSGGKKRPAAPTIVSSDLRIDGNITSSGEIQVDGVVNGDVKCAKISIGENGSVKGAVTAERALVRGKVTGQIKSRVVTLTRSSRVTGDVLHETLAIEPGARLEGNCRRMDEAETSINLVVRNGKPA